jgi:alkylation response protein AidB-like acyl-CoA dehydrogenase
MVYSSQVIERAREVAETVLFPGALETDARRAVPAERLDALASAGLYGLFGPASAGGLDADPVSGAEVTEILAGACLTTAFVWMQHHSAVLTAARAESEALRSEWLGPLCRGQRRAGVAFAGLRRPGPPILTARWFDDSWILDGSAPWVTGWGRVDVVHTAARDRDGNVVWMLVDATASPSLRVERLELSAVNASATVSVVFEGHEVGADRVTLVEPMETWMARDAASLARNGSFPLGLARRCSSLMGTGMFDDEIDLCRRLLFHSAPATVVNARCRAADLAVRAAAALVASGGGRSVLVSQHAQRLAREAMFLLVFGQTPSIRIAQLALQQEVSDGVVKALETVERAGFGG